MTRYEASYDGMDWIVWAPPPQGIGRWLLTFETAYDLQKGRRPSRDQAYILSRRAQDASELPLSIAEVRQVIETAWLLSSGRLLK